MTVNLFVIPVVFVKYHYSSSFFYNYYGPVSAEFPQFLCLQGNYSAGCMIVFYV